MSETETETTTEPETDADGDEGTVGNDEPNPDAEPEPEPEPIEPPSEPAPEPAAPESLSPKEREKQQKALDAEAKRHTERVANLLGDEADDAILCPLCDPQLQGFLYPSSLEHPRDDVQARMVAVLTSPNEPEYSDAPNAHRCEACDGWGNVKTGARKAGNQVIACATCKGRGYVQEGVTPANGSLTYEDERQLVAVGGPEPVLEDADAWGSPRILADGQENPNYGKMPQYKNPDLP